MDPLSICASILALLGAGGQIGKGLKRFASLRDAPSALYSLTDNVNEIRILVQDIENLLLQLPERATETLPVALTTALSQAKATILKVEQLIAYDLTIITEADGSLRVDKSRWLRSQHQVQALKAKLQSDTMLLYGALGVLTL